MAHRAQAGTGTAERGAGDAASVGSNRWHHPPKPRFALTVGIIGHRPKDLAKTNSPGGTAARDVQLKAIAKDVHFALSVIKGAAKQAHDDHATLFDNTDSSRPHLTLVSALAEGADTIAAKAALSLEYALDVPLPFAQPEYEKDFGHAAGEPSPLTEFRILLKQARAVLQLPGQHRGAADSKDHVDLKEKRAYEAVGLTVLSQSDILLAVWDRQLSRGRGGTADMIAEAARAGIAIILVDANGEKPIELRWRGLMSMPAPIVAFEDLPAVSLDASIHRVMDELVRPPSAPEQRESFERWFEEKPHRFNIRIGYPLLTTFLFARRIRGRDIFLRRTQDVVKDYVKDAAPVVDPNKPQQIASLSEPYGWADAIGVYFAQIFRSAFVMNFLFAALAVIAASASALMSYADERWKHVPVAIEIFLIVCVVLNTALGRRWRWHHRWVEAREVAERLRAALPLWTLGLRPAFFAGEEPTWTGWYARALVRAQGLRAGNLMADRLTAERTVLLGLLTGQCNYNRGNAARMHWVERGLEVVGMCLLAATVAVAFDHLLEGPMIHGTLGRILPAEQATDFEGIFQRAERTHRQLDQLITAVQQDPADFALLRARARSAADAMLGDVASWRLSAESRGLAIPG